MKASLSIIHYRENATPHATTLRPATAVGRPGVSLVIWYTQVPLLCNYSLQRLFKGISWFPFLQQCRTGCWCCNSSHLPCHVACITVQLVVKCPVSSSLHSWWLRSEMIVISLLFHCMWLLHIPGDLIRIRCRSRPALLPAIFSACLPLRLLVCLSVSSVAGIWCLVIYLTLSGSLCQMKLFSRVFERRFSTCS